MYMTSKTKNNPLSLMLYLCLSITISDAIQGTFIDILSPISKRLIPGDVKKPTKICGFDFYLKRWLIRIINLIIALTFVKTFENQFSNKKIFPLLINLKRNNMNNGKNIS